MSYSARLVACLALVLLCTIGTESNSDFGSVGRGEIPQTPPQALYDYIKKPDAHYSVNNTGIVITKFAGWKGYILNMTSQGWLSEAESDRPIWWHYLVVIVPDVIQFNGSAFLYITGNDNTDAPPEGGEDLELTALLAVTSGTVGATLFQVPNQPIVFPADPQQKRRSEDALVAFTWNQFMKDQSRPEWISLFPMVKSAVRALDTIQAFAPTLGYPKVDQFVVGGASKRGWTTWLTGAVDSRIFGLVPIVMDMLNFEDNLRHMYKAYGGWTFAFSDYYDQNLTALIGTQEMRALAALIDPQQYASALTMPKMIVDSTGDEFFMPDDDWYWWGSLPGESFRLMVQNAEHSMATGVVELLLAARAFYRSLLLKTTRPKIDWNIDANGTITVVTDIKPHLR